MGRAYASLSAIVETQFVNDCLYTLFTIFGVRESTGHSQQRGEGESLAHRQVGHHDVVLHHVGSETKPFVFADLFPAQAVDGYFAFDLASLHSVGKQVQHGSLTRPCMDHPYT